MIKLLKINDQYDPKTEKQIKDLISDTVYFIKTDTNKELKTLFKKDHFVISPDLETIVDDIFRSYNIAIMNSKHEHEFIRKLCSWRINSKTNVSILQVKHK